MRKLIAAINMTLDGYCDHTAMVADDELHQHYTDLLRRAGALLYGRITYQLMESYWPEVVKHPTGNKSTDEFAKTIEDIPKIVFSHTLQSVGWTNAKLAQRNLKDETLELKNQPGKDIFAGSPSLIVALSNLKLIDEYQICIHPVLAGGGLQLFKNLSGRSELKWLKTKTLGGGQTVVYYCKR